MRYTVPDAARILGISPEAVRNRLSRGTLDSIKEGGTVYVLINRDMAPAENDISGDIPDESTVLISEMRERIAFLERELERRSEESAEMRRLLAAALERMPPQLEAPSEGPESPVTPAEDRGRGDDVREEPRSWWRRWFQSR